MKIIQALTLLFIIITPVVCLFNAWWCWSNRWCNGESSIVKMKSKLWASIALTLAIWVTGGIIDPDHRIHSLPGALCGFSGAFVLFFASCRFLAFHLQGGKTLHPEENSPDDDDRVE